jgi:hypothetical protein
MVEVVTRGGQAARPEERRDALGEAVHQPGLIGNGLAASTTSDYCQGPSSWGARTASRFLLARSRSKNSVSIIRSISINYSNFLVIFYRSN